MPTNRNSPSAAAVSRKKPKYQHTKSQASTKTQVCTTAHHQFFDINKSEFICNRSKSLIPKPPDTIEALYQISSSSPIVAFSIRFRHSFGDLPIFNPLNLPHQLRSYAHECKYSDPQVFQGLVNLRAGRVVRDPPSYNESLPSEPSTLVPFHSYRMYTFLPLARQCINEGHSDCTQYTLQRFLHTIQFIIMSKRCNLPESQSAGFGFPGPLCDYIKHTKLSIRPTTSLPDHFDPPVGAIITSKLNLPPPHCW